MPNDARPQLEQIKDAATQRLLDDWSTLTATDAASLANVRKAASEAAKLEIEVSQLRKTSRSESVRFWVPIGGTFLSVAILASTLLLQTGQFRASVEQNTLILEQQQRSLETQRNANEDAQWRESLKLMADKQGQLVNDAAGLALLRHFSSSDRIGTQARNLAAFILGYTTDPAVFQDLFQAAVPLDKMEGLLSAVKINRAINSLNSRIFSDIDQLEIQQKKGVRISELPTPNGPSRRVPIEGALSDLRLRQSGLLDEIDVTNRAIESLLRSGHKVRGMDLSKCFFRDANFASLDFAGTNLTGSGFAGANLAGTDFTDVTAKYIGNWGDTAWWRSKRIAPGLLMLLKTDYPFPEGKQEYLGSTRRQYDVEIARLQLP